jgi:hypothetical protein
MANTIQIQKKKRSKTLDGLLENLIPDFDKLQPKVDAVFEQGRKEGFSDMETGDLIRNKMKKNYTDRTIQRVLPASAKHIEHIGHHKETAEPDKMSGFEQEIESIELPADKVTVTRSSTEAEPTQQKDVAPNGADKSASAKPPRFVIQESEDVWVQADNWSVDKFNIDDLDHYPLKYCRKIIREIDEKRTEALRRIGYWGTVNDKLRRENKERETLITELRKENADLKARIPNLEEYDKIKEQQK